MPRITSEADLRQTWIITAGLIVEKRIRHLEERYNLLCMLADLLYQAGKYEAWLSKSEEISTLLDRLIDKEKLHSELLEDYKQWIPARNQENGPIEAPF